MGIYSGQSNMFNGYSVYPDTIESIMEDNNIEPAESEDIVENGYNAVMEINENYNTIMQRIGVNELQALEETGEEFVYTEGVLSNIYTTIKNFLKKIWEKIKALFKRFMMIIDSYTKNDKDFLNKYRKELGRVTNLTDFEFKGYKWNETAFKNTTGVLQECSASSSSIRDIADKAKNSISDTNDELDSRSEKFDDFEEEMRGKAIEGLTGKSSSNLDASEFKKELKEAYYGSTEKETLDTKDIGGVHKIITELSTSKDIKKGVADAFKASKKSIENDDKFVDNLQKNHKDYGDDTKKDDYTKSAKYDNYRELAADTQNTVAQSKKAKIDKDWNDNKQDDGGVDKINGKTETEWKDQEAKKVVKTAVQSTTRELSERTGKTYSLALRTIQLAKNILIQVDTAYLQAWKDRSRQNKAIAIKMVYHKPKNEEAYNESYTGSYTGDNFLANIQLK